jgi:NitT/TauT family transport system substrate-binding protein
MIARSRFLRSGAALATASLPARIATAADVLTLRMAGPRYVGLAPLYLGINKGFYTDQGLKPEMAPEQDTASSAASLMGGALDIAFVSTTSLLRAISNGLKLRALSPVEGVIDPKDPNPSVALLVTGTSPIKSLKDLNGKTVAVPTLNSGLHMETMSDVDKHGGDSKSVKFTQLPFSAQAAALTSGRVDAIACAEPYKTLLLKQGARAIGYPDLDIMANSWVVAWCASDDYIAKNTDVVKRFIKANATAMSYAARHLDEARAVIPTIVPTISAEEAKTTPLGTIYVPNLEIGTVLRYIELLTKYGNLSNAPDPRNVIYTG